MLKPEFHIIFMCHKIFLFWIYFQLLGNEKTILKLMGCIKVGGRLDSVCGCRLSRLGLYPEPWFSPTCPSLSSEQARTQSSSAQWKSERELEGTNYKLREDSLVGGCAIFFFFLCPSYWGYTCVFAQEGMWVWVCVHGRDNRVCSGNLKYAMPTRHLRKDVNFAMGSKPQGRAESMK